MHDRRSSTARGGTYSSDQAFDYSEGDDVAAAVRQSRHQIAEQIRRVAAAESYATPAVQAAYQRAAELAEGQGAGSADEKPAGRPADVGWIS